MGTDRLSFKKGSSELKEKIFTVCLSVIVAVVSLAGASLAYFTDTADAENVFTVGKVSIALIERQRSGKGKLESFTQGKPLLPSLCSEEAFELDEFGMPTAANYVDKIVTVENTGSSDAYVRVLVAIPAVLEAEEPSDSILHWSTGEYFVAEGDGEPVSASHGDYSEKCKLKAEGRATLGETEYNIYSFTYTDRLAAGEATEYASLTGFYLDGNVGNGYDGEGKPFYTFKGERITDFELSKGITVPVFAQAVQAAGFEDAETAFTESGLDVIPFGAD